MSFTKADRLQYEKDYKLNRTEAVRQYRKLFIHTEFRPLCESESGFVERLSHRALYQRYLCIADSFIEAYKKQSTNFGQCIEHYDDNRRLLKAAKGIYFFVLRNRLKKRLHAFYQSENDLHHYLRAACMALEDEITNLPNLGDPLPPQKQAKRCCIL